MWFAHVSKLISAGLLCLFFLIGFHEEAHTAERAKDDSSQQPLHSLIGRDLYYKIEGPISGPPAPKLHFPASYGRYGTADNRSVLWIFIQQHFFFGSFILGCPMIAWGLELYAALRRRSYSETPDRYDRLAQKIMQIALPFYPFTIFLGGILLAVFLLLYNRFFTYMAGLFRPVAYAYGLCFLLESFLLYGYTLSWNRLRGQGEKWVHLSLGALAVTNGIVIICLANAWMSFMMSPAGVDSEGRYLGDIWRVIHTTFWNPLNVHRVLASIMFSGAVISALSAYWMLMTRDPIARADHDWTAHVTMMISICGLILLPFAGYWFAKVIFIFRQRMGMTLMGGELSWHFVVQAMLIGFIFLVVTYYLWQGTARMPGSERYHFLSKCLLVGMVISFLIWTTPHTMPASGGEFKAMGGSQHPVVGYYGTMAAKNTAINTMLLIFGLSMMLFRRCNKVITVSWRPLGNLIFITLFVGAEINIVALGMYGYAIPANVRVGLALPQFLTTVGTLIGGGCLNFMMLRGARTLGPIRWGTLHLSGAISLFVLAGLLSMTMTLMGYIRSSVRLNWHITEIMEDVTPWATIPGLPYAIKMVLLNVVIFWGLAAFIFGCRVPKMESQKPRGPNLLTNLWHMIGLSFWHIIFKWFNRVEVYGTEHIPKKGEYGVVFAYNHISAIDPFFVGITAMPFFSPVWWRAPGKEELFRIPVVREIILSWGCFPVKRGKGDIRSIEKMVRLLQESVILIAPEGTRSTTGQLLKGKAGVGKIIYDARPRKVIPVRLRGVEGVLPKGSILPRIGKTMTITYGAPIDFSAYYHEPPSIATSQKIVDVVMAEIAGLGEGRGV